MPSSANVELLLAAVPIGGVYRAKTGLFDQSLRNSPRNFQFAAVGLNCNVAVPSFQVCAKPVRTPCLSLKVSRRPDSVQCELRFQFAYPAIPFQLAVPKI